MGRVSRLFMTGVVLAVAMLIAAFTANAQTRGAAAPAAKTMKNPVASTPASITAGAGVYKKYCAFCHGLTGKGDGPLAPKDSHPADLTDAKWDRGSSDGDIFTVIRDGAGPKFDMKGFRSRLTTDEMWSLVHYLRSIGPQGAR